MDFNLIKEVSLYVKNLEIAETFYTEMLGFEVISRKASRHIFFRTGCTVLLCFIADTTQADTSLPPHGARGSIHIACGRL